MRSKFGSRSGIYCSSLSIYISLCEVIITWPYLVTMFYKWQIVNINCSFLKQNLIAFMLLIKNHSEGNALFQSVTFPPVVQAVPYVFLIYN